MKFAVTDTEALGIVKTQGFVSRAFEHDVPVIFHAANVQLGAGLAVTFTSRPTASEHPDGHDGLTEPSPTIAVVNVADGEEQVPWAHFIVTVRTGAWRVSP